MGQNSIEITQFSSTNTIQKYKQSNLRSQNVNIAGRLRKNSRHGFVDLQSQKNCKKDRPKKFYLISLN